MDEIAKLIDTLRRVEALYDGATTPGERVAPDSPGSDSTPGSRIW